MNEASQSFKVNTYLNLLAVHSKMIKVDYKGFDFYCHKKEEPKWTMGVKLISLI